MTTQARQPAGIPVGGQFATTRRAEAPVTLLGTPLASDTRASKDWGATGVHVGSRTPWGCADHAREIAPGITQVSTPGHGGIKLSPERNAEIPIALRNRTGWYEEDCEAAIPMMYHAEAFCDPGDSSADLRDQARATVINWFPDQYEKATGQQVSAEESLIRAEQQAAADAAVAAGGHAHEFVSTGWGVDSNGSWVPDGYTVLAARVEATGEEREFLVPREEAIADHRRRDNVVIDPNRHIDVTGIGALGNPPPRVEGPKITGEAVGIDYAGLTPSQARRARDELEKRWRFANGDGTQTVESLAEHLARVGVVGKEAVAYGNKPGVTYSVEYGGGYVQHLSKAAFDALTGVPDTTTDVGRAEIAERNADVRLARATREYDFDKMTRAQADLIAAQAALKAAHDVRDAQSVPWGQRQNMRAEALARLLAERGIELGPVTETR